MGRIQKARSGASAQNHDSSDHVRWPQFVRSGGNGSAWVYLQEHWARRRDPQSLMGEKKKAITDVAAGLVFRNGKLLITLRYDDAHLGGLWEFPGGKVEPGETFEQCLLRELQE